MNPQANGGPLPPTDPNQQQPPSYGSPLQQTPAPAPVLPQPPAYPAQAAEPEPYQAQQEHYDFIMNPHKPGKKWLTLPGNSYWRRIVIAGGGAVVVIILSVLLSSVFGGHTDLTPVIAVAQDQTELARVASIGTTSATDSVAQNVAYTVSLSITSAQQQITTYLANNHKKVGTKQLDLKHSTKTTVDLKNALATSTFDTTFMDDIQQLLGSYAHDLNAAYQANPGPRGRQLLANQYKGARLLIAQAKQPLAGS